MIEVSVFGLIFVVVLVAALGFGVGWLAGRDNR